MQAQWTLISFCDCNNLFLYFEFEFLSATMSVNTEAKENNKARHYWHSVIWPEHAWQPPPMILVLFFFVG